MPKKHLVFTLRDFATEYAREKVDKVTSPEFVKVRNKYTAIARDILKELSLLIIKDNLVFKIPERLGYILIVKEKLKSWIKITDYYNTKKYKTKIIQHNLHTKGFIFSFYWHKFNRYTYFTNQSYYTFDAIRDEYKREIGTRGLAQEIDNRKIERNDYNAPQKDLQFY